MFICEDFSLCKSLWLLVFNMKMKNDSSPTFFEICCVLGEYGIREPVCVSDLMWCWTRQVEKFVPVVTNNRAWMASFPHFFV